MQRAWLAGATLCCGSSSSRLGLLQWTTTAIVLIQVHSLSRIRQLSRAAMQVAPNCRLERTAARGQGSVSAARSRAAERPLNLVLRISCPASGHIRASPQGRTLPLCASSCNVGCLQICGPLRSGDAGQALRSRQQVRRVPNRQHIGQSLQESAPDADGRQTQAFQTQAIATAPPDNIGQCQISIPAPIHRPSVEPNPYGPGRLPSLISCQEPCDPPHANSNSPAFHSSA